MCETILIIQFRGKKQIYTLQLDSVNVLTEKPTPVLGLCTALELAATSSQTKRMTKEMFEVK